MFGPNKYLLTVHDIDTRLSRLLRVLPTYEVIPYTIFQRFRYGNLDDTQDIIHIGDIHPNPIERIVSRYTEAVAQVNQEITVRFLNATDTISYNCLKRFICK